MLVFSLAKNEGVVVGDDTLVTVLEIWDDTIEIAIEHPRAGGGEYEAMKRDGCDSEPAP